VPGTVAFDQDSIYGVAVRCRLRAIGIRDRPIARASPWQNGFAERLIGSIRRECLDRAIVLARRTCTGSFEIIAATTMKSERTGL
jgi:hypothetical protein